MGPGDPSSSAAGISKAELWAAEMVSQDSFYAFPAVAAASDHGAGWGGGGLSVTNSSPFSSGVALAPLLPYFSIHLREL